MEKRNYLFSCLFFSALLFSFSQEESEPLELSLDRAIEKALENNSEAKQAKNRIRQAIYRKREAISLGLPQINLSVDYQNFIRRSFTTYPSEPFGGAPGTFMRFPNSKQSLTATGTLDQLIFDGSFIAGLKSAKTYLRLSENQKEKTDYTIRESVISSYANALVSEENIEIIGKNLKSVEELYRETSAKVKNGFLEEEDAEQIGLNASSLKNELNRAIQLKEVAYQALMIDLGLDKYSEIKLSDNLETLTLQNITDGIDISDFQLENHVDYRIAEENVESNRLSVQLQKAKALPTLKGFADYTTTGRTYDNALGSFNKYYPSSVVGLTLSIPVFSGLGRHSKTQRAKIDYENAKIQFDQTQLELNLNAKTALTQYEFSVDQYRIVKENLRLAERIENKQNIKFSEGVTSSQELTVAQQQLYRTQNQYLESMYNLIVSKAQLDNAIQNPLI